MSSPPNLPENSTLPTGETGWMRSFAYAVGLNPTIRKQLIASLKNASQHLAASQHSLSADFKQPPSNGKAHQRLIREYMATQPEADLEEKMRLAADFKNATVREITYDEAKNVIMANEWLGNLGNDGMDVWTFLWQVPRWRCVLRLDGGNKCRRVNLR